MGLCNTIPGTRVVGEWGLPILHLARAVDSLARWEHVQNPPHGLPEERWPHYGLAGVRRELFASSVYAALLSEIGGMNKQIWTCGFKENDWRDVRPTEYPMLVSAIKTMLGRDTLFLLLDRSEVDALSSWHRPPGDEQMMGFAHAARKFHKYLLASGEQVYPLHYEEIANGDKVVLRDTLRGLFFRVAGRSPTEKEMADLLHVSDQLHSSNPRTAAERIARRADYP